MVGSMFQPHRITKLSRVKQITTRVSYAPPVSFALPLDSSHCQKIGQHLRFLIPFLYIYNLNINIMHVANLLMLISHSLGRWKIESRVQTTSLTRKTETPREPLGEYKYLKHSPRFLPASLTPCLILVSTNSRKMPAARSNTFERDDEPFVEVDPTGRFGRYNDLLGAGAVKKVYRAFDQHEGIEVAWNQVRLRNFIEDPVLINRLYSEVQLLRTLKNKYIIVCYSVWLDEEVSSLNFITEVCTSGNLRDYRKKHRHVSLKALKKWSKQVLEGLEFLHTHDPCVIHRDLNCSNIFVNGNSGQVKIGDLGFATIVGRSHTAHSILGTPEFMAPELYEEDYTEMVDIYSFGLCLLEMVTMEIPYSECDNVAKIYKKVTSGVKPQALNKVADPEVKAFILKCIAEPRARPSASDLLKDAFFSGVNDEETVPATAS